MAENTQALQEYKVKQTRLFSAYTSFLESIPLCGQRFLMA